MPLSGLLEDCIHVVRRHTCSQNTHTLTIKVNLKGGRVPTVPDTKWAFSSPATRGKSLHFPQHTQPASSNAPWVTDSNVSEHMKKQKGRRNSWQKREKGKKKRRNNQNKTKPNPTILIYLRTDQKQVYKQIYIHVPRVNL